MEAVETQPGTTEPSLMESPSADEVVTAVEATVHAVAEVAAAAAAKTDVEAMRSGIAQIAQGAALVTESLKPMADLWSAMKQRFRQMEDSLEARQRGLQDTLDDKMKGVECVMDETCRRVEGVMEEKLRDIEDKIENRLTRIVAAMKERVWCTTVVGAEAEDETRQIKKVEEAGDDEEDATAARATKSEERASLEARVAALESSVQRAMDSMFPRVEEWLKRVGQRPSSKETKASPAVGSGGSGGRVTSAVVAAARAKSAPASPAASSSTVSGSTVAPARPLTAASRTSQTSLGSRLSATATMDSTSGALLEGVTCRWVTPPPPYDADEDADELVRAASEGRCSDVERLLASGVVSPDARNANGDAALHMAAYDHAPILRLLLNAGANVNLKGFEGWTPLHCAAQGGFGPCIAMLLDHGADIESRDDYGWTPLHWAACNGHEGAVRALVRAGASIVAGDQEGETPFDVASTNAVRELLID